jgi:hypothetical protein
MENEAAKRRQQSSRGGHSRVRSAERNASTGAGRHRSDKKGRHGGRGSSDGALPSNHHHSGGNRDGGSEQARHNEQAPSDPTSARSRDDGIRRRGSSEGRDRRDNDGHGHGHDHDHGHGHGHSHGRSHRRRRSGSSKLVSSRDRELPREDRQSPVVPVNGGSPRDGVQAVSVAPALRVAPATELRVRVSAGELPASPSPSASLRTSRNCSAAVIQGGGLQARWLSVAGSALPRRR